MDKYRKMSSTLLLIFILVILSGCSIQSQKEKSSENLDSIRIYAKIGNTVEDINYWYSSDGSFYYFLPSCTDPDQLYVDTENGITLRKKDQSESERHIVRDGEQLRLAGTEDIYLLGCYDKDNYLYEVPVIFMKSQNIPSVFIHTSTGNIQPVVDNKENRLPGIITISNADGTIECRNELDYIKGRGNSSQYFTKRPFNLKFQEPVNLFSMGLSKRYCLLSQETDQTFLRNKISFDMAKKVGLPFSPDTQMADLWIDGDYWGLYLLTDAIQVSPGAVDIRNLEAETKAVNSARLSTYPKMSKPGNIIYSEIPNTPQDVTGGYLLEVDKLYYKNKENHFRITSFPGVTLKSPSCISESQMDYISTLIRDMDLAIRNVRTDEYQDYIDLDSWVKMGVLEEFMANSDFMDSSQYFYKDIDQNGVVSPVFAGPIWDMDHVLEQYLPNVFLSTTRHWYRELYARPEFKAQMVKVYEEEFLPLLKDLSRTGLNEMANEISVSAGMNNVRWKDVRKKYNDTPVPFETSVQEMKDYLNGRIEFMNKLWIQKTPMIPIHITQTLEVQAKYYYINYFVEPGSCFIPPEPTVEAPGKEFVSWCFGTPAQPGEPIGPNTVFTEETFIYPKYRDTAPQNTVFEAADTVN